MKNILITGCNGYVARNITKQLNSYNITLIDRNSLDLLDSDQTKNFFKDKYFDAVIHTATSGGSRLAEDQNDVFYKNCLMHQNLLENSPSFDKYISFGSGAELDRRYNIDESADFRCAYPIDPYGMSKNFIAKSGLLYLNFYNIRIFNVFNFDELPTRMIKANIMNYMNQKSIVIHQDKYMDFFFMDDLCKIVKFVIESDVKQKTINCSYKNKYKLSDIAKIINNLSFYDVDVIIENQTQGLDYYGDYNLHLFDINLSGLELGIVDTYERLISMGA